MNGVRRYEIKAEAVKRLRLWVENESFKTMTCNGSMTRLNIALALRGYPFEKKSWMGDNFESFISEEEFNSDEYDEIADEIYDMGVDL